MTPEPASVEPESGEDDSVAYSPCYSPVRYECPSEVDKCNADELTFEEYVIGTCCKNASRWTDKTESYECLKNVQNVYEEAKDNEIEKRHNLIKAEKNLLSIKQSLAQAEQEVQKARDDVFEAKKWRNTVQGRLVYICNEAMKDDRRNLAKTCDSDAGSDDIEEEKETDDYIEEEQETGDDFCSIYQGKVQ